MGLRGKWCRLINKMAKMNEGTSLPILWEKYLSNSINEMEWKEFIQKMNSDEEGPVMEIEFKKLWNQASYEEASLLKNWKSLFEDMLVRSKEFKYINPSSHHIHFIKTAWFKYAAAIILMLGLGAYLWINNTTSIPANTKTLTNPGSDISAGSNKAILTLSDGSIIELENKDNGKTLQQLTTGAGAVLGENSAISKTQPSTQPTHANEATAFNTIATPRGGQYQIVLSDGSKVWLNAASSIKFPTVFAKERTVEITGECYLEVTTNRAKPFLVKANGTSIEVLGTSFNINAYPNEPALKTTLLEGIVKINNTVLKPGEAYINGHIEKANIEQDIAWKNGIFNFEGTNLPMVMRQLERWYDIKIICDTPIGRPYKFRGELERNLTLSQVLKILTNMNMKYKLEGRTLIIKNE